MAPCATAARACDARESGTHCPAGNIVEPAAPLSAAASDYVFAEVADRAGLSLALAFAERAVAPPLPRSYHGTNGSVGGRVRGAALTTLPTGSV